MHGVLLLDLNANLFGAVLAMLSSNRKRTGAVVSKSRALIRVLAGIAGAGAIGALAYAVTRRGQPGAPAHLAPTEAMPASPSPLSLRESMVVARSSMPEPVTVVLDSDGVFRGEAELEATEPTVQCDLKLPLPASAEDGEPPQADELGGYWLRRAMQSERSLSEGDLDIDLDNLADFASTRSRRRG